MSRLDRIPTQGRQSLTNRWNKIHREHNNDPWSEINFGTIRRGSSNRLPQVSQELPNAESSSMNHMKSQLDPFQPSKPTRSIRTTTNASHNPIRINKRNTMQSRRQYRRPPTRQGVKVLKEIKKYQNSTNLLINRTAFGRLCREIASEYKDNLRFSKQALEAIHQVTEWYIVGLLSDTKRIALHCRRSKIEVKDLQLAQRLRDGYINKQFTF
eukprot:177606_1